jgi:hypothetical protein
LDIDSFWKDQDLQPFGIGRIPFHQFAILSEDGKARFVLLHEAEGLIAILNSSLISLPFS